MSIVNCKKGVRLDCLSDCWSNPRSQLLVRYGFLERSLKRQPLKRSRRLVQPFLRASADDKVVVNGSPQSRSSSDFGKLRANFTGSVQDESNCNGLIQALHDAARTIELALKEKIAPSRFLWFSATWLGADRNAWVKTLSYQVRAIFLHFPIHDDVSSFHLQKMCFLLMFCLQYAQFMLRS